MPGGSQQRAQLSTFPLAKYRVSGFRAGGLPFSACLSSANLLVSEPLVCSFDPTVERLFLRDASILLSDLTQVFSPNWPTIPFYPPRPGAFSRALNFPSRGHPGTSSDPSPLAFITRISEARCLFLCARDALLPCCCCHSSAQTTRPVLLPALCHSIFRARGLLWHVFTGFPNAHRFRYPSSQPRRPIDLKLLTLPRLPIFAHRNLSSSHYVGSSRICPLLSLDDRSNGTYASSHRKQRSSPPQSTSPNMPHRRAIVVLRPESPSQLATW